MSELASNPKLDLLRGDILVELHVIAGMLEIAAIYISHEIDERLEMALSDAREHMRTALGLTARLMQERKDTALNAEAAGEWRAQRGAA